MKYRKIGTSGLKVSVLSLGSWLTYGDNISNEIAHQCIKTAIEHGINFFDSAEGYGHGGAETVLGDFFSQKTYDRDDFVISSKVFWPMSENINRYGLHRKNIKKSIEGTLSRLKMDYLDIYFMHRFDYSTPLEETISVLDDLIHEGKINAWGTSVWTAAQLERVHAIAREIGAKAPVVEQPQYNMLFRHIELEIMDVARNLGMGFTVFSPLAQGVLTGKYNDGIPEKSRATYSEFVKNDITKENIQKVRQLGALATKLGITLPHLSLAWILRRSEISAAIIGASKPSHVTENVPAADIYLNETTLAEIETILQNKPEWPATYAPVHYYQDKMR